MQTKRTWPRRVLWLTAELLLLLAALLAIEAWQTREVPRHSTAELAAQTIDGQPFDIRQWHGSGGVIYFWAEWCPVCRANRHVIESLAEDYPVITVAMQSGSHAEVAAYMAKERLTLPVVVDEDGAIARRFHVTAVPVALVIDRQGRIRHVARGYTTELGLRVRLWLARRAL